METSSLQESNLQEAAALAYRLNKEFSSGSAYCYNKLESILEDFSNNITTSFCYIKNGHIVGVLSCYVDYNKNTADCSLLIDELETDYNDTAWRLLSSAGKALGECMEYNFFFPKYNPSSPYGEIP